MISLHEFSVPDGILSRSDIARLVMFALDYTELSPEERRRLLYGRLSMNSRLVSPQILITDRIEFSGEVLTGRVEFKGVRL